MNSIKDLYHACLPTPFAVLGIRTEGPVLTQLSFLPLRTPSLAPQNRLAARTCRALEAYLEDPRYEFALPLKPEGTAFQLRTWQALQAIPIGESRTYGEIARQLHTAPRAIGGACGKNPIALIIPCHRVIGSAGALGGFMNAESGEPLKIKRWLLQHEGYRFGT